MLGVEVFRPLRDLRALLHQGMLGISAAARGIFGAPAIPWRPSATAPPRPGRRRALRPPWSFEDVTFGYPGGRAAGARAACRFAVAPGERVAIVGPSGSGKSTVARLLLRFYDPSAGASLVGGRDMRDLPLERAPRADRGGQPGHLSVPWDRRRQPPHGQARRDPGRAGGGGPRGQRARVHPRLPQGYDTLVGERGVRLSGGQRQRIAIARALLRDAPILVLDEALSRWTPRARRSSRRRSTGSWRAARRSSSPTACPA